MVYDTCNEESDIYRELVLKKWRTASDDVQCRLYALHNSNDYMPVLHTPSRKLLQYNVILLDHLTTAYIGWLDIELFVRKDDVKILMQITRSYY